MRFVAEMLSGAGSAGCDVRSDGFWRGFDHTITVSKSEAECCIDVRPSNKCLAAPLERGKHARPAGKHTSARSRGAKRCRPAELPAKNVVGGILWRWNELLRSLYLAEPRRRESSMERKRCRWIMGRQGG